MSGGISTFKFQLPDGGEMEIQAQSLDRARLAYENVVDADPDRAKARTNLLSYREKAAAMGPTALGTAQPDPGYPAGARVWAQGATMGGADEALAALRTPVEMIKQKTINPVQGYNTAKATEDVLLDDARKRAGKPGVVAEMAGGLMTGSGLAKAGLTSFRPGMGYLDRVRAGLTDGLVYGGTQGALEGRDGLASRIQGAGQGATLAAGIGGAIPGLAPLVRGAAGPAVNAIMSRADPEGFSAKHLGRILMSSGRSMDDIEGGMRAAQLDGQGATYTLADELGHPGRRAVSMITRTPGEAGTRVAEGLDARMMEQPRRVQGALEEGFDAPRTAQSDLAARKATRGTEADANYTAARNAGNATDVDLWPALNTLRQERTTIRPGQQPQTATSIDRTLSSVERRMVNKDGQPITDFNALLQVKKDLDDIIEKVGEHTNHGRVVGKVRDALDEQLAQASQPYANARDTFRQQSKGMEAIEEGRKASRAGRVEDTVPKYQRMAPDEQAGFRHGYVDPLIEAAQNAPQFADRARPLMTPARQTELREFAAPGRGPAMLRRLSRERAMGRTYEEARTGSRTQDNFADAEAAGLPPEVMSLAGGKPGQAATQLITRIQAGSKGMTPEVKDRLARILLASPDTLPDLGNLIQQLGGSAADRQRIGAAILRGLQTGPDQNRMRSLTR